MKFMILMFVFLATMVSCSREADTASYNLSKAADSFEISRRIVFYNGITGDYILTIEGLCSIGNDDFAGRLSVTCKTGADSYKKHFLGLSDNVTFFSERVEGARANVYHYRVAFRPSVIIPTVEVK